MAKKKRHKDPTLPNKMLYATSARIGGIGLDSVAHETLIGLREARILRRAIAFDNYQTEVPAFLISTLRWHPVRLLSFLDSQYYYGAKKGALDRVAARALRRGNCALFHGWSGECLHTLRVARRMGIPTVIEVPTWHRNKGRQKSRITGSEKELIRKPFLQRWQESLLVTRQQVLEEYDLADLIMVLSDYAAETFLAAGVPERKIFRASRGVDPTRFQPGEPPMKFRAIFVGSLIKRKGVHLLLEAWHRLGLKDAELFLVGHAHREIEPYLAKYSDPSVRVIGFSKRTEDFYGNASLHILPSSCEGSAKTTYEASACGLPQITTRESGDVVEDGVTGLVIPSDDVDALAAAIERMYQNPDLMRQMGKAGRQRILEHFTWDHYRQRVLEAYRRVYAE